MAQALTMLDYNFLGFFSEPVAGVLVSVGLLTVAMSIIRRAQRYFGWSFRRKTPTQ